jgi:hypothetical protein
VADGTNRSVADAELTQYAPPSRRALLKAAALGAAGATGIGMPLVQGPTPTLAASAGPSAKPPPASPGRIASTAFSYRTTAGYQFIPLDNSVNSKGTGTRLGLPVVASPS